MERTDLVSRPLSSRSQIELLSAEHGMLLPVTVSPYRRFALHAFHLTRETKRASTTMVVEDLFVGIPTDKYGM